jgi:hypothetical protein
MAFTTTVKNNVVDTITALGSWISLHTADPSTTGASEAAVSRKQTTWPAASNGVATGTQTTHANAPAAHYTHYGVWTAETNGTFRWGFSLDPGTTLDSVGTIYITPRVTFP